MVMYVMYSWLLQQLKESWEYDTAEERKTDAEKLKEKGNRYFKVIEVEVFVFTILFNLLCGLKIFGVIGSA